MKIRSYNSTESIFDIVSVKLLQSLGISVQVYRKWVSVKYKSKILFCNAEATFERNDSDAKFITTTHTNVEHVGGSQ